MIFKTFQGISEFVKMEYGKNRLTEYHDRTIRLKCLTFLRKLKYTSEEKSYEVLKYSMLPFILIVWLSYELTWKFLVPEDYAVRLVLFIYLTVATLSLYNFETVKKLAVKCFKLLWVLLLFTIFFVWLFHEREQTEDDIMMEGYRHVGPPYFSLLHEPGFFQIAYLGIVEIVILFLILAGLNYLVGRCILKTAKWFANRALQQDSPDIYLQKYLDYLIAIPCALLVILVRYFGISINLF